MDQQVAADHLQVIRTLMERSALYRRTLAPIMLYIGSVGTAASAAGLAFGVGVGRSQAFGAWWLAAAMVALAGAFLIARRQALGDGEPFWSPPTRRVTQAVVPPLAAGFVLSVSAVAWGPGQVLWLFVLPNALFYGCAVHAAGFFMPRGMKLFGWVIIVLTGVLAGVLPRLEPAAGPGLDHVVMGGLFGLLQLAYGVYLYVTESRKKAA